MIDYEITASKCEARKMPKMAELSLNAPNPEQAIFLRFIKSRIDNAKIDFQHKALFVNNQRISSGQYFCFMEDGRTLVIGPNAFNDLFQVASET